MKEIPKLYEKKQDCCGCTACSAGCPKGAITMQTDAEGFSYPVIDGELCVSCNRCLAVCPFKQDHFAETEPQTIAYAARAKDQRVLEKSTSGGMFVPISNYILEQGGAVACCIYDYKDNQLNFQLVTNPQERDLAIGSKYINSQLGDIFQKCLQWLLDNPDKNLLFVGMGCQAAGFRSFMKTQKMSERVYVVDIICHGLPSDRIWKAYAEHLEKKYKGKLEQLAFRDKRKGWSHPIPVALVGGKEVSIKGYSNIFYSCNALKPSCYACPYATVKRQSDWTIGDYWGIEKVLPDFYDEKGNSLILVHTPRGNELFNAVSGQLDYCLTALEDCLQPNLVAPTARPAQREQFWRDYQKGGIHLLEAKYGGTSYFWKGIHKIRRLLKMQ